MHVPRLLIVQMGVPPAEIRAQVGEQAQWFSAALADQTASIQVVHPETGAALPDPDSFDVAIITGSWAMVSDREPWSERVAAWIVDVMGSERRLLGVCYGHQLMAHALGGTVGYHPAGSEVGMQQIELNQAARHDALLAALPAHFPAHLSHAQTVLTLPPSARVLARSAHDPHQIIRYSERSLSVQFHPEFTPAIMRACIERRAADYAAAGQDVNAMLAALAPADSARRLLRDFVSGSV